MELSTSELILRTLPENMKENGFKLIKETRVSEEEQLNRQSCKYRRYRVESVQEALSEEQVKKNKMKTEKSASPISVAKLVMEVWSPQMRHHAEKIILKKAVEEKFLTDDDLKWVHVLKKPEEEVCDKGWFIDDVDNIIIELLWNRFNIKEHFQQTSCRRMWIQRSYDRLKEFIPNVPAEIIERHDLSKFAFSQAIGYTLKWVHGIHHEIWKAACDLHLHYEPHHTQMWSNLYTPEEKEKKLKCWVHDTCDFHKGFPYGLDIANFDFTSEDFPEPFLLESFLDMVAVEWERKKGKHMDISLRELVYMEDKFLSRYSKKQHQMISNLMVQIISSDDSLKYVSLTEREKMLMSTVPQCKHALFVCQAEIQKKYEENRLIKLPQKAKQENEEIPDCDGVLTEEAIKRAHDTAFLIMIARTIIEMWNDDLRKKAQLLILNKAIEEKFISDNHLKWVLVFDKSSKDGEMQPQCESTDVPLNNDALLSLLWVDFNIREHFSKVHTHRQWLKHSYSRLARFMPELPEEVIERHDLSKFALSQIIGYTLKWVHGINHSIWRKSCDLHLHNEPHHTQMWSNKHTPDVKQACLKSWLCMETGGSNYGVEMKALDLTSENMAKVFLLESLLDMVAVEWERKKDKKPDLTYTELIDMEDRYLARYTEVDKAILSDIMNVIRSADNENFKAEIATPCTSEHV